MTLDLQNITHFFGRTKVLDNISLKVLSGEVVCLLGPSGCGKTTLLRIIAGLESLQQGQISIENNVVAGNGQELPPETRGVGFLFQDFALFPHLDVLGNAQFGLGHVRDKSKRRDMAVDALKKVGMDGYLSVCPHQLSGGQQQRIALARALAPRPRIILLDEPFSSLDTRLRSQIRDDTLHVLKKSGVATVMVTHDPEEAMFMGDSIVLMHQGGIVQQGDPEQLYYHPASAFVATFFSEVNQVQARVENKQARSILGAFPAPGFEEKDIVQVMFRPEAVLINPDQNNPNIVQAVVETSRVLPGFTLVHLRLDSGRQDEAGLHIHASVPGLFRPANGQTLPMALDPKQVFIFPRDGR